MSTNRQSINPPRSSDLHLIVITEISSVITEHPETGKSSFTLFQTDHTRYDDDSEVSHIVLQACHSNMDPFEDSIQDYYDLTSEDSETLQRLIANLNSEYQNPFANYPPITYWETDNYIHITIRTEVL